VTLAGWLVLQVPLVALARWLRRRPVLHSHFAEAPRPELFALTEA